MRIRISSAVGLLLTAASIAAGQLPNPALTQVFPPGAQVGQTLQVTVAGRDLDEGTRLLFSHPGIVGSVRKNAPAEFESEATPVANQFDVEVASNVPPGRYDVRVVGRFGVSTPRTFLVDTIRQVVEPGGNNSREQAAELPHDVVVYGRADGSAIDYFKVSARQGQSFVIECLAQKIDSRMQPVVVVWDEAGKQLRRSRQTLDPIVEFTAPADGSYYVGVHDHVFGGGGELIYRLQVRSRPYIAFVWPPVGKPRSSQVFTLIGRNLPDAEPAPFELAGIPLQQRAVRIFVPESADYDSYGQIANTQAYAVSTFAYQWRGDEGASNVVRIGLATLPVTLEEGDNDLPSQAQKITVPTEYAGNFYPRRDQDWVEFSAKKGQQFQVSVLSNRLGHYTDPEIFVQRVLTDEKGAQQSNQVKTQDDNSFDANRYRQKLPRALDLSHQDPDVTFSADSDAVYRIGLRDLFGGSRDDPRLGYRLLIRPLEPDFRLVAWTQRQAVDGDNKIQSAGPTLRRGGVLPVYLHVLRRGGFNGPIRLTAEGLPPGVTAHESTIESGARDGVLMLDAADDASRWEGTVRIVGTATMGDQSVRRVARGASLMSDTGDVRNVRPKSRLTNDFVLAIVDADPAPAAVAIGEDQIIETSLGAKLELPLSYVTRTAVKGELNLAPIGAPGDLKAPAVKLAADAKDGKVQLTLDSKKTPLGTHTFFMRGKVKLSYARNPQAIERAEKARQAFDAVVSELTAQEQMLSQKLEQARQVATAESEILEKFEGVQQSADESLQQATQTAEQATQQLKAFQEAASASRSDPEINKAVADAEAAVGKAVEQLKTAQQAIGLVEKRLAEFRVRRDASQKEVASTEESRKQMAEKKKRAEEFKKTLDKRIEDGKKNWGPKDIDTWVDSNPITLRILKSPIQITPAEDEATLHPESDRELNLSITRRFGFADEVQLDLQVPDAAKGISCESIKLSKDQNDGAIKIAVAKDATKGAHRCTVRAKLKFNGLDIDDEIPLVLNVH